MKIMSFNDSVDKDSLENKAKSIMKSPQTFSSLTMNDLGIYLKDGPVESDIGIVSLHPSQCTHWVIIIHASYFD